MHGTIAAHSSGLATLHDVALEPNQSLWRQHAQMARDGRRPNVAFARNVLSEDVAEALSHSNEFLDGLLLMSLHTARPFDHGVKVDAEHLVRLDKFVGHLLSLARRSLLLLPSPSARKECLDNRLANWVRASASPKERLKQAGQALGLWPMILSEFFVSDRLLIDSLASAAERGRTKTCDVQDFPYGAT